ncbi:MAG: hypothetical protein AB1611_20470 [bacterium]
MSSGEAVKSSRRVMEAMLENAGSNDGDSSDTGNEKPSGRSSEAVCAPEPAYDEVTVHYLRTIIGLIEGHWVSRDEILAMGAKIMRQHSFFY